MAALQSRNGSFRIICRHSGKQHTFTIGKVTNSEADAWLGRVEHLLIRIQQALIDVPPDVDVVEYVRCDGTIPTKSSTTVSRQPLTLGNFQGKPPAPSTIDQLLCIS